MKRRSLLAGVFSGATVSAEGTGSEPTIRIVLDPARPGESYGTLGQHRFPVGMGRNGITGAGRRFRPGFSLLGEFRINAILSYDRFEMEEKLVRESGKPEKWLRENLFRNMSSIDFDGDGKGGEYGAVYIGLRPVDSPGGQPFHFGEYKGVFRWYSYAIHGTQDESRVGKKITGGCINLRQVDLEKLLLEVQLEDRVTVVSAE